MDENPYEPPEHYAERRAVGPPWSAYVVVAVVLMFGAGMAAFGFYHLVPGMVLGGLFWMGIGFAGAYFVVRYRRKSN
jgi:hypothetical protein